MRSVERHTSGIPRAGYLGGMFESSTLCSPITPCLDGARLGQLWPIRWPVNEQLTIAPLPCTGIL
jgi:hypothetical protein